MTIRNQVISMLQPNSSFHSTEDMQEICSQTTTTQGVCGPMRRQQRFENQLSKQTEMSHWIKSATKHHCISTTLFHTRQTKNNKLTISNFLLDKNTTEKQSFYFAKKTKQTVMPKCRQCRQVLCLCSENQAALCRTPSSWVFIPLR